MSLDAWVALLASTMRLSTPLILAALGGLFSERSGVINIGLEGLMLASAFAGMLGSYLTGSAWIGLLAAVTCGMVLAAVHAVMTVRFEADQIISGLAINLIALGGTAYLLNVIFGTGGASPKVTGFNNLDLPLLGDIPILGPALFQQSGFVLFSLIAAALIWIVLYRTPFGLRLRAAGEGPRALDTSGVNVQRMRMLGVTLSGLLCGIGGAFLSLSLLGGFTENMTAGRGFIALAALIFGRWTPFGALGAAILFGFGTALTFRIPQTVVDTEFLFMIPYVITLVGLAGFGGRAVAPAAIGEPYRKE